MFCCFFFLGGGGKFDSRRFAVLPMASRLRADSTAFEAPKIAREPFSRCAAAATSAELFWAIARPMRARALGASANKIATSEAISFLFPPVERSRYATESPAAEEVGAVFGAALLSMGRVAGAT